MDIRDYLEIMRRRWLSLVVVILIGVLAAAGISLATTKKYTATTRLFFAVRGTASVSDLAQGSSFAEKQMVSYVHVATSPLVLDPVIRDLDLPMSSSELASLVAATVPTDTVILDIAVTEPDARQAAEIANAIGVRLATVAAELTPAQADGSKTVKATTLARAQVPQRASFPNVPRNLVLGLGLGLILGVGVALLRQILDTKIRSEADVRELTERPVLGLVSYTDALPAHPIIVQSEPHSPAAEAVRRLRTNLQFIDVARRPKSIVITSSIGGEGKSTMAVNLAVSLADTGAKVVLVDADLRRPSIASYTGLEGAVGLTNVLIGQAEVADVVQPLGEGSLDILTAGPIPPNPSELLGSEAMAVLLEQLNATYDIVLLDSPPVLPVTDAAALSTLAGGAVVVVGADRIHRPQLLDTLSSLETAGAHVFGMVVNKISRRDSAGYGYSYSYEPHETPASAGPTTVEDQADGGESATENSLNREPVARV